MSEHPETRDLLGPYVWAPWNHTRNGRSRITCKDAGCREEAQELRLAHERLTDLAFGIVAPPEDLEARVVAGYRDVKPADAFRPGSLRSSRSSACSR